MFSTEKIIGIFAVTAVVIAGVVYGVHSYNSAMEENGKLKAEAVQWAKAVKDYQGAVGLQNTAIEAWKKRGDQLAARVNASQRDIANLRVLYIAESNKILQLTSVPKTCPEAIGWAVDYSKGLASW